MMRDSRSIEGRLQVLEIRVNGMITTLKEMQNIIDLLIRMHRGGEKPDGQEVD
jgi:hypothetical protein